MPTFLLPALWALALPPTADDLDRVVRDAVDSWKVPGLAIAIIHDDRVVLLKGYGVESLDSKKPVSRDSIFPLASCSKPFTATMLATLVDEKKLWWDDPVRKHLTYFRLRDPVANERVTIRDLLCHRTGLGEHVMLWYRNPLPLEERVKRLAFLEPDHDFRVAFRYQTTAFDAAGLAGAAAAGKPWADALTERVLTPLGMTATTPIEPKGPLADGHRRQPDGVIAKIARYSLIQPDPAGSVHSNVRDLIPFLRVNLSDGTLDGKKILSPERLQELHEPNMIIPRRGIAVTLNPETVQLSYGLGWITQDYRGRKMLIHGGAIDGFRSQLCLIPDIKLGIAILSNLDNSLVNYALTCTIVDRFLEAKPRLWNDELQKFEQFERDLDAARSAQLHNVLRPADAKPLRPLGDYEGTYDDPAYGPCKVTLVKEELRLEFGDLRLRLEHFKDHLFITNDPPFHDASFEFLVSAEKAVTGVRGMGRTFPKKAVEAKTP